MLNVPLVLLYQDGYYVLITKKIILLRQELAMINQHQ